MYRKSMALYSCFVHRVYIHLKSLWAGKKKSISKFQKLQCKRVCKSRVSNTLAVYLDLLPLLDFFLESFFLVLSSGGGGYSSSSLSSSSPCPSSSSSSSSLPATPRQNLHFEQQMNWVHCQWQLHWGEQCQRLSPPHHCCPEISHSHPQTPAFQHAKLSQQ